MFFLFQLHMFSINMKTKGMEWLPVVTSPDLFAILQRASSLWNFMQRATKCHQAHHSAWNFMQRAITLAFQDYTPQHLYWFQLKTVSRSEESKDRNLDTIICIWLDKFVHIIVWQTQLWPWRMYWMSFTFWVLFLTSRTWNDLWKY